MTGTPIAKMVREMIARGVDAEVIELAVGTAEQTMSASRPVESPVDITAEKRRAYDRKRKNDKRNSTGNSTGPPPDRSSALSSESKKEDQKERKEEAKRKRSTGHHLPESWKPNADHYREGRDRNLDARAVDAMAQDMRLWAAANAHRAVARKSDWDQTFLGWIRREASRATGPPRKPALQGFESLFQQPETADGQRNHDTGFDLDLTANPAD